MVFFTIPAIRRNGASDSGDLAEVSPDKKTKLNTGRAGRCAAGGVEED